MNRLIAVGKLLLLASGCYACVMLGLVLREARSTIGHVNATVDQVGATAKELQTNAASTTKQLNQVLEQTHETLNQVRHVSMDERKFAAAANAKTLDVLGRADSILAHVSDTVDSANVSQKQIAAASVEALQSLPPAAQASTEAMQKAAADLESLNAILRDQNIPLTLAHVNQTAAHLDSTSDSLDKAVKRWTKPGSILKSLFTGLLDTGSKLAVIAK